ncbi:MAG: hypothetical protein HYZ83_01660 [Candidatus Omnitrophica bacterium]|nr:hypothetical protein [Candidatus Omnitrophota bacterium]
MKTKHQVLLTLILPIVLIFFASPQIQAKEFSVEAKLQALRSQHGQSHQVGQNTLASPLISATSEGATVFSNAYLSVEYGKIEKPSFSFNFETPHDLRNRWVRVRYSGLDAPEFLRFRFENEELKNFDFKIYVESSLSSQEVFFKLPDKADFSNTNFLDFAAMPSEKSTLIDFHIEGIDVLPKGEEPLALQAKATA